MPNEDGFPGLQEPFVPPTINLHIILDVSPSMEERWPQTLSGLNEYMYSLRKDQQDNNQDYQVTMTTFSNQVEKIYDRVVLDKLPTFSSKNLSPYGSGTALYKAIHQTLTPIDVTGPVLVVIITDGEDNQSTMTDQETADKVLTERQKLGNYTFAYLGVAKEAWGNVARFRSAQSFLGATSRNITAAAYDSSLYDASAKGLAGSTLRYSRAMRSNAVRHAPQASMNVSKFFDDTPNPDNPVDSSPACATSNADGWQTGK